MTEEVLFFKFLKKDVRLKETEPKRKLNSKKEPTSKKKKGSLTASLDFICTNTIKFFPLD